MPGVEVADSEGLGIMDLFKSFAVEATLVAVIGLVFGQASCGGNAPPPPKHTTSQHPTDENGQEIEKPIPTGCNGKITKRKYRPDTNDFMITYHVGEGCKNSDTASEVITFEQDLNATCTEGDYFPICLTPGDTEPPGMRLPSDDPNN